MKPGDKTVYGFSKPKAEALSKLVGGQADEYRDFYLRGGGASSAVKIFATPSGGILAATGSPPTFFVPSALCTRYEWQTSGTFAAIATSDTALVYNICDQPIAGNVLIKAVLVDGRYIVDVAGCGTTASGSFQVWTS